MFGVIVAGRLVQTDFQQVDPTHIVFSLNNADAINHITVFLTGQIAFPDNYAGAVYFSLPDGDPYTSWQYLGFLSNEKPSAVFRVAKLTHVVDEAQNASSMSDNGNTSVNTLQNRLMMFGNFHRQDIAQIGISIESFDVVKTLTPAAGVNASTVENVVEYTQKLLENFVNYASSFAVNANEAYGRQNEMFIPSNVVQKWFDNFKRRLDLNPYFWKN